MKETFIWFLTGMRDSVFLILVSMPLILLTIALSHTAAEDDPNEGAEQE